MRRRIAAWAESRALDLLEAGVEARDLGDRRAASWLWRGHRVMAWVAEKA